MAPLSVVVVLSASVRVLPLPSVKALSVLLPAVVSTPPEAVASVPPLTLLLASTSVEPAPVASSCPTPLCVAAVLSSRSVPPRLARTVPALDRPAALVCNVSVCPAWLPSTRPTAWFTIPICPAPTRPDPSKVLEFVTVPLPPT